MSGRDAGETREAGRSLDAEIAEKVMGVPFFNAADDGLPLVLIEEHTGREVAFYSTDIAAAWLVVEKMREDGFYPNVFVDDTGDVSEPVAWFCECDPNWRAEAFTSRASTAPLAICIAALKAYAARATLSEKTADPARLTPEKDQ